MSAEEELQEDERPDLEDMERAEVPEDFDDISQEVEEEAGLELEDVEDVDEELEEPGLTVGDAYVEGLVGISNALIETHGKPEAEKVDEGLARDFKLHEHFNRFWKEQGYAEELPPGRALGVFTAIFLLYVTISQTTLIEDALEDLEL